MNRFRNWILVLVVGLLLVGWVLAPLAADTVSVSSIEDAVIVRDPVLKTPVPTPENGTEDFAWGG